MKCICNSVDQLPDVARQLLDTHADKRVFAFFAPMGAGKTTFITTLCTLLGCQDNMASPTFAIVNEYADKDNQPVYHFDFYRIRSLREVMDIGFDEYVYSGCYCFMEWAELVEDILPTDCVRVHISVDTATNSRIFEF